MSFDSPEGKQLLKDIAEIKGALRFMLRGQASQRAQEQAEAAVDEIIGAPRLENRQEN